MILAKFERDKPAIVPAEWLVRLGLKPGDEIVIELVGDRIVIGPANDRADGFIGNFSTFTEWDTEADREAFRDL